MRKKLLLVVGLLIVIFLCNSNVMANESQTTTSFITKGRPVPDFEIKINGSGEILSRQKLMGTIYFLDFWMSGCKKCRDTMPFLTDIYQQYQGKKFKIISISLDESFKDVESFRRGKWKMPWLHSLAVGGFENELTIQFEVNHLPKLILVDIDGKIIGTNEETSEGEFKKALSEWIH